MIKLIFMVMFMFSLVELNNFFFYMYMYNFWFLLSFFFLFLYLNVLSEMNWVGVSLNFGVDNYSYFLIFLLLWIMGLMFMSLLIYEFEFNLMMFFLLNIMVMMFFLVLDMMLFYLFFEVSLIPIFVMIIMNGFNFERLSASFFLLMYMMLISFFLLIYIMMMNLWVGSSSFNMVMWKNKIILSFWSYLMVFLVFYIKLPMYMFHIWLPKAHVEASVYGSMFLAAILLKLGGYGLIRMMLIYLNETLNFNNMIISIGLVGMIFIGLMCLIQIDMKIMIAYFSVIHMNMLMCSLMTLNLIGLIGSFIMMIMHGLCSSGLFFMVGLIYKRSLSRLMIINKGLMNLLSGGSLWWFYLCMVNFSFPISVSFISEILILSVMMEWNLELILLLMMICFLSSICSLYLFSYIFHGNWYLWNKLNFINFKEFMILIIHSYPICLYVLNLVLL